jgi:hypothetical protein
VKQPMGTPCGSIAHWAAVAADEVSIERETPLGRPRFRNKRCYA